MIDYRFTEIHNKLREISKRLKKIEEHLEADSVELSTDECPHLMTFSVSEGIRCSRCGKLVKGIEKFFSNWVNQTTDVKGD